MNIEKSEIIQKEEEQNNHFNNITKDQYENQRQFKHQNHVSNYQDLEIDNNELHQNENTIQDDLNLINDIEYNLELDLKNLENE